ncbi:hypothetical protein ABE438_17580 [Bosea sp. TWI1241]|uniref:hypothetical protein n=1 Tax=Bosea sp. TWI1241 TaxID=3148904 RepID=UPI00320934C9
MRVRGIAIALASGLPFLGCQAEASQLQLRTQAGLFAPVGTYRIGVVGQRAIFGTSDLVAICYALPGDRISLVLRAADRFFAMNGHARDSAAGGTITWQRSSYEVVDPHRAAGPISDFISGVIRESQQACSR